MAQNMATQKMVENIIDGTTPPKRVKNALSINVNGKATVYDGSASETVIITHPTNTVQFTAQSLTTDQQAQARTNISAASQSDVETAQTTADTAKTNASKAQTTADTAKSNAATAQAAAEAAQATADTNTSEINKIKSGSTTVAKATNAAKATQAVAYLATDGTATNFDTKFNTVDNQIATASETANTAQANATTAQELANNAQTTADEAKSIAEGRARAITFMAIDSMCSTLSAETEATLKVGDNIFIHTADVPDFWVAAVQTTNTSVSTITDFTPQTFNVGFYTLCKLETQKVDLTDYATLTDLSNVSYVANIAQEMASSAVEDIADIQNGTAVPYALTADNATVAEEYADATGASTVLRRIDEKFVEVDSAIADIEDGTTVVAKAASAQTATTATKATTASNYDTSSGTIKDKFDEVDAAIEDIVDGTTYVQNAKYATNANSASSANQAAAALTAWDYYSEGGSIKTKFDSIDESVAGLQESVQNAQSTADKASTTATNAQSQAAQNATNISNLQSQVNERPTNTEVDEKIKTAIDDVVDGAEEAFDTLKEVSVWIKEDKTGTSALVNRVSTNETAISELKEYAQNHCVMQTLTLSAASWSNKLQTISVSAVKSTSLVKAYPLSNDAEVINNGVSLSAQSAGTIVFSCTTAPTADIAYQLEIYNVTSLA